MDIGDLHFLGDSVPAGGVEHRFNCPFCEEEGYGTDTKYHMYVNPKKGAFFCHRCSRGGSLRTLFRRFEEDEVGSHLPPAGIDDILRAFLHGGTLRATPVCPHPDVQGTLSPSARNYLHQRGIDSEDIKFYEIMEGIGRMANRVIVPEYHEDRLVCWVGRSMYDWVSPKYKNAPGQTRRGSVFNLEKVISDSVIITEGVFDAISAGRSAIALYGKHCTKIQLARIVSKKFKRYFVALDPDARKDSKKLCEMLWGWEPSGNPEIWVVTMPAGEDPSSLGRVAFRELLVNNAERYHPNRISMWM